MTRQEKLKRALQNGWEANKELGRGEYVEVPVKPEPQPWWRQKYPDYIEPQRSRRPE